MKIMEIGLAMLTAISLSIRPEILSGPEALEVSLDFSNTSTSCLVQRFSGHSWLPLSMSIADGGGSFVLKQSAKKLFSMFALSMSLLASCPLRDRVGMVDCPFLKYFTVFQNNFLFDIDRLPKNAGLD